MYEQSRNSDCHWSLRLFSNGTSRACKQLLCPNDEPRTWLLQSWQQHFNSMPASELLQLHCLYWSLQYMQHYIQFERNHLYLYRGHIQDVRRQMLEMSSKLHCLFRLLWSLYNLRYKLHTKPTVNWILWLSLECASC